MADFFTWENIGRVLLIKEVLALIWRFTPKRYKLRTTQTLNKLRGFFTKKSSHTFENFIIGDLVLNDCRLLDGIDSDFQIVIQHKNNIVKLPDDLIEVAQIIKNENREREIKGLYPIYQDLKPFGLESINFKRDEKQGENNICIIKALNSSFYNSLITKDLERLLPDGQTIKKKYYDQIIKNPLNVSPDGLNLISALGVNVLVITSDNKAIIVKRNAKNTASSSGKFSISVCEHLNEEVVDFDIHRNIQANNVAKHGLYQELGILESEIESDIKFFTVGFMPSLCHYEVVGMVRVSLHSNKIISSVATAKDGKFEISDIEFVEFTLSGIITFFKKTNTIITEWLVLTLIICLQQDQYKSLRTIEKHFSGKFWKDEFMKRVSKA